MKTTTMGAHLIHSTKMSNKSLPSKIVNLKPLTLRVSTADNDERIYISY